MGVRSRSTTGEAQFALAVSTTVVTLTVPRAGMCAEIYVRTAAVVFTRDGSAPTATRGIQAAIGDIVLLNSRDELDKVRFIRQGATDAALDVEYFTALSTDP